MYNELHNVHVSEVARIRQQQGLTTTTHSHCLHTVNMQHAVLWWLYAGHIQGTLRCFTCITPQLNKLQNPRKGMQCEQSICFTEHTVTQYYSQMLVLACTIIATVIQVTIIVFPGNPWQLLVKKKSPSLQDNCTFHKPSLS